MFSDSLVTPWWIHHCYVTVLLSHGVVVGGVRNSSFFSWDYYSLDVSNFHNTHTNSDTSNRIET